MPADLTEAVEARLAQDDAQTATERQEAVKAARAARTAEEAREARWQAMDDQERLRLAFLAHKRGMSPLELMDIDNEKENQS